MPYHRLDRSDQQFLIGDGLRKFQMRAIEGGRDRFSLDWISSRRACGPLVFSCVRGDQHTCAMGLLDKRSISMAGEGLERWKCLTKY